MHLEVIKLLQVRLEKTLYNRAEDQVMVWAYLRGISDAAIKNKKEGHFVMLLLHRRYQHHFQRQ